MPDECSTRSHDVRFPLCSSWLVCVGSLRRWRHGRSTSVTFCNLRSARADRRSVGSPPRLGFKRPSNPRGHIDLALVILLHPGVFQQLCVGRSSVGLFQKTANRGKGRVNRCSIATEMMRPCSLDLPTSDKILRSGRVLLGQPGRRSVHDGLKLSEYVLVRLGRVGVTTHGQLDDGQTDRPDVG